LKHLALAEFWSHYGELPEHVQKKADKNFRLLKKNPRHPSLHFKKVSSNMWSARVGRKYRAVAFEVPEGYAWFWIGPHTDYERILNR
jgi:mRNA-degrading endonuclease RelE of RelBE toxin-antitoxin system